MKKLIFLILLISSIESVTAQNFDYNFNDKYTWDENPSMHLLEKSFDSASVICVYDDRQAIYKNEEKELAAYYTFHKTFFIRDDRGIELLNKLYIPISEGSELTRVQLRVIYKNGKIKNIDSASIKNIDNEGKQYAIFAIEGLEKGCEFEYMYKMKYPLFLFDSQLFQFDNYPCQLSKFSLISPSYLRFQAKGYNGMNVSKDSLIGDTRIISGFATNTPQLEKEKYAYRKPYLKRIDFKLSYNLNSAPNTRLYTWKELAKKVFSNYTDRNEKEVKALDGFIARLNIPANNDPEKQIIYIEEFIKSNLNYDRKLIGEDGGNLDKIISTKSANFEGISKLFCGVFDKVGINYQMVFPSDRSNYPIDEELEYWNRIDEIVFYFPGTGKFLTPTDFELRYPFIPFTLTESRGLFLKGTTIGNFRTAIGSFGDIKMEPFTQHYHNMDLDISLKPELDSIVIKCAQIFGGYAAHNIRPVYTLLSREKQDQITQELIKPIVKSSIIKNTRIENASLADGGLPNKPLIVYGEATSSELLESAGKKILLKVGELIGPQVEMYQEKKRQFPIELDYPHALNRRLVFHIPEGYSIVNLNDLLFDVTYKMNNEIEMGFVTHFNQKANVLEILIEETYLHTKYPIEQFPIFQKIINASADFNKVVLVLSKNSNP